MKKLLSLVLAMMMLATMGLACAEGEKTTVVFWNSWTGGDGDALQALVTKFNESQNEVYVDMTRTTSFGDMLQTALPTGEAADLILLNVRYDLMLVMTSTIDLKDQFRAMILGNNANLSAIVASNKRSWDIMLKRAVKSLDENG